MKLFQKLMKSKILVLYIFHLFFQFIKILGISLETQSSSEDLYNFKQPELLDESGCANG